MALVLIRVRNQPPLERLSNRPQSKTNVSLACGLSVQDKPSPLLCVPSARLGKPDVAWCLVLTCCSGRKPPCSHHSVLRSWTTRRDIGSSARKRNGSNVHHLALDGSPTPSISASATVSGVFGTYGCQPQQPRPGCFMIRTTRWRHDHSMSTRWRSLKKCWVPEHYHTATNLNNLALMLHLHDDHTTARQLFERALAIHEKVLGPNHRDTATSLGNLALLLEAHGDRNESQALFERALPFRLPVRRKTEALAIGSDPATSLAERDWPATRPSGSSRLAMIPRDTSRKKP
jgi:hypothetical protein